MPRYGAHVRRRLTFRAGGVAGGSPQGTTSAEPVWKLGYRPALDGVRGVAILLVLVGHTVDFRVLRGAAETGVTLFFVLSGFLITALLAQERRDTGRLDFGAF